MSTTTTQGTRRTEATSSSSRAVRSLDLAGRAVLLAMDGSESAIACANVARAIAAKHGAVIHVVSVLDTSPAPIPPPLDLALAMGDAVAAPALHAQQVAEVRAALAAGTGHQCDWPVRIKLGIPASAIVQGARDVSAALVLVGLRRHGRLDRAVHDETALNVMRHASCPVLGVVAGTTDLPSRVLAAVDFSESSLFAARSARALVGDNGVLVLAYVPPLMAFMPDDGERVIRDLGVESGFARIGRDLAGDGITFDHVVLRHESPRPISELLLDYAEGAKLDLIAAGSSRQGRIERWIVGSVSTELVRDGRRSVLVVPPRDGRSS